MDNTNGRCSVFCFHRNRSDYRHFAERPADAHGWYRLPDFYDYVRNTFGDRLTGGSYSSNWLRIVGTLDRLEHLVDVVLDELRVLKVIALLNLLDTEYLLPTRSVLEAASS